jgi:hypothetical protein
VKGCGEVEEWEMEGCGVVMVKRGGVRLDDHGYSMEEWILHTPTWEQ